MFSLLFRRIAAAQNPNERTPATKIYNHPTPSAVDLYAHKCIGKGGETASDQWHPYLNGYFNVFLVVFVTIIALDKADARALELSLSKGVYDPELPFKPDFAQAPRSLAVHPDGLQVKACTSGATHTQTQRGRDGWENLRLFVWTAAPFAVDYFGMEL